MGNSGLNLQDGFLNRVRQKNLLVNIQLTNGTKLEGKVRGFDNLTLVLSKNGREYLIYKHAVSTIIPLEKLIPEQNKTSSPQKGALEALAEKYNKK